MKRTGNKGVSLIEILIAVVVFTICITPIALQLSQSIRIGQRADDQQAAIDYAKAIAETMKQMEQKDVYSSADLAQLADDLKLVDPTTGAPATLTATSNFYSICSDGSAGSVIPDGSYLTSGGAVGSGNPYKSVTQMQQAINQNNIGLPPEDGEALVRKYTFSGVTHMDYRDYQIDIEMNTEPYALASLQGTGYQDPNATNIGNLSSLNANTTAVITEASTYDAIAIDYFFNRIISELEGSGSSADEQVATLIREGRRGISAVEKNTNIEIKQVVVGGEVKYNVKCILSYSMPNDAYGIIDSDQTKDYAAIDLVYDELPDVYLLYNQFMYTTLFNNATGARFGSDKINIKNELNDEVSVYVIRTAENDSKVNGIVPVSTNANGDLIPTAVANERDVVSGGVYLYHTDFALEEDVATNPVKIFTNIPLLKSNGDSNVGENTNSKTYKIRTNFDPSYLATLDEDERYSEVGRLYNIKVTLTRMKNGALTNDVTTIDTSKGDY